MSDLVFSKINESVAKFSAEPSILQELSDCFSFDVENKRFSPKYRAHLWDGKIRLFSLKTNTAPVGLIPQIIKFCVERNYTYKDITPKPLQNESENTQEAKDFLNSLSLPFKPRDYQTDGFFKALQANRCLMLAPTGSGKSLVIYMIARWMIHKNRKTVIIVPSVGLVTQMINDFKDYAKNDKDFIVDDHVAGLHSKTKTQNPFDYDILVSTWQSLAKYDNNVYNQWDCVICDESHKATAKILNHIIGGAKKAKFKIGLTGSLSASICHEYQLTGLFGTIFKLATTKELQDKKELNNMKLYMLDLKYPKEDCKYLRDQARELKKTYIDELEFVNTHSRRQLFIRNLVCSLSGTTLVLFRFIEHGKILYDLIKEMVGDKRPVFYIDGKVNAEEREKIRQSSDNGLSPILVFSVATSSTGVNIKSIENLIICPAKSKITTLQSIGRCLRLFGGKDVSKVFDIVDDLRYGRRINYLYKHATNRLEIYMEQDFDVIFKEIDLGGKNNGQSNNTEKTDTSK